MRLRVRALEAERDAMLPIALRLARVGMYRDVVTLIESCLHCSLKRSGEYEYSSTHDEHCVVNLTRRLGY